MTFIVLEDNSGACGLTAYIRISPRPNTHITSMALPLPFTVAVVSWDIPEIINADGNSGYIGLNYCSVWKAVPYELHMEQPTLHLCITVWKSIQILPCCRAISKNNSGHQRLWLELSASDSSSLEFMRYINYVIIIIISLIIIWNVWKRFFGAAVLLTQYCTVWTESLGDCSFLNTCFHMDTCKYVHYQVDYPANHSSKTKTDNSLAKKSAVEGSTILYPPQVWAYIQLTGSEYFFHNLQCQCFMRRYCWL